MRITSFPRLITIYLESIASAVDRVFSKSWHLSPFIEIAPFLINSLDSLLDEATTLSNSVYF